MNPIKEIFTGGACNADDMQRARGAQNPFKNFMQNLITGRAGVRERMETFYPEEQTHPQMAIQQQMDATWNNMALEFHQKARLEEEMMNQMWASERARLIEMNRQRMIAQHQAWEEATKLQHQQEMEKYAQEWSNQFVEQHQQETMEKAFGEEEQKVIDKETEQNTIRLAAGDMMEVMMSDPDPKFKESKFLQFLQKLNTGELKIEENELVHDPTKAVPMEEKKEGGLPGNFEDEEFKENDQFAKIYQEAWKLAQDGKEGEAEQVLSKLEAEYSKVLQQLEKAQIEGDKDKEGDLLVDAWQAAQDVEEQSLYRDIGPYTFNKENQFLGENQPLEKALFFISAGRTFEAIMALEAHLQKNPEDATNWRVLGRLHQENDDDQRAVPCLLKANQIDPTHLDTHLSLGVSCTNTLDEVRAMNHLNKWLLFNEKYRPLGINPQIIPPERLSGEFRVDEVKEYNKELLEYFLKARQIDPHDPGLHSALAVLYFIQRNYELSVECFRQALQFDQSNYSLWNKLGATLAHLGRTEEAIEAYHRALDLKPNYVRVWVNLGIAHAFKGDYEEAARFYLNALSFNPNANHLWSYLNSSFVCMDRFDLVGKIQHHDVNLFRNEFDILTIDQLPIPEMDYKNAHMQYVVQQESQNWAAEFQAMAGGGGGPANPHISQQDAPEGA